MFKPVKKSLKSRLLALAANESVFRVILVRIFPHSEWMWRDTDHLSVLSSNAGKCGPE